MFYWLSDFLIPFFGPFRLLHSHALLFGIGALLSGLLVWLLLPRFGKFLPKDSGKVIKTASGVTKNLDADTLAAGKPTGAGFFISIAILPIIFLFFPWDVSYEVLSSGESRFNGTVFWDWGIIASLYACMFAGYFDDKSKTSWGRLPKLLLDLGLSALVSLCLCRGESMQIWLPFTTDTFLVAPIFYIPCAAIFITLAINFTNCSDGVDGLAGSLSLISILFVSLFLYIVVGHSVIADYLLLPASNIAAKWAILGAIFSGAIAAYLWYNVYPSSVLMGDAGSRMIGMVLALLVLVSGNPFLIIAISPMLIVDGLPGLVKIIGLRFFKLLGVDTRSPEYRGVNVKRRVRRIIFDFIFHKYQFPLHDYLKKKCGWHASQVVMRFILLQTFVTPILFILLVKIR